MSEDSVTLSVTSLSQFVSFQNCERYLRFRIYPKEEKELRDRWDLTIQPLTPLLTDAGMAFEQDVEGKIAQTGEEVVDLRDADEAETIRWIKGASAPVNLLQAPVSAQLGRTTCRGQADIVRLHRDKSGKLHAHIADAGSIDTVERSRVGSGTSSSSPQRPRIQITCSLRRAFSSI